MTSCYFETVVTADSTDRGKCSIKTSNRHVSFRKLSLWTTPAIFCVFLSDLMGFWDASGAYHLAKKSGNIGLRSSGKAIFRKIFSEMVDNL